MVPFLFAAVLTFVLAPVASLAAGQAVDIIWEYTLNPSPSDDVDGPVSLVVPPDGGLLVAARDGDRTVLYRFDNDGQGGLKERFREPRFGIGGPLVATRSGRLLSLDQRFIRDDPGELAGWSSALASWVPTSPYAGPLWLHDYGANGVDGLTFETVVDFGGPALFAVGHYFSPSSCTTNVSFTRFDGAGRVALQRHRDIEKLEPDNTALPPGARAVYAAGSRIIWSGALARQIRENSTCGVDGDDVADIFSYWSLDNSFLEGDLDADVDMAVWNFDEFGNVRWRLQFGGPTTWEYANQVFGLADGGAIVVGFRQIGDRGYITVMRLDANGNVLWVHDFTEAAEFLYDHAVIVPQTEEVIVVAEPSWRSSSARWYLARLSADGILAASAFLYPPKFTSIHEIAAMPDGSVAVVGADTSSRLFWRVLRFRI